MAPPVPIPIDVRVWLRDVFEGCNRRVATTMSNVPNTWESSLDMTFIQHFIGVASPHRFGSGWTVEIATHFLGGGRHFAPYPDFPTRRWEIADIGILVMYRQGGRLLRTKVVLLQSKRLYPNEQDLDEETAFEFMVGFGRLLQEDDEWSAVTAPRQFNFTPDSRYQALITGLPQYSSIETYEAQRNIPVYYLLYNPLSIPSSVAIPMPAGSVADGDCDVGCRIVPARGLRAALAGKAAGHSPAYNELRTALGPPFDPGIHPAGWRLEHFVVDLVLDCEAGHIAVSRDDEGLYYIFNRRTAPITAALAVTLDAPG